MSTALDNCNHLFLCEHLEATKEQRAMAQRLWRDKPCPYGQPIAGGETLMFYCEKKNIVCTLHEIGRHCDIYTEEVTK